MEVSPNLDNIESDSILEDSSTIKKKSRQKKSFDKSPTKLAKNMTLDKKRKNSETKMIETSKRNGFHDTDHSESEMDTSIMENPEDDQVPMEVEDGEPWYASTVSGLDLTSRPAAVSFGGKYVLVNSSGKIMVYSSKSGQLVRKLNTGQVLAIQRTDKEEEVVVATKKKVVIWNFVDVKAATKFKISSNKVPNYEGGLQSSYIPENFHKEHEIYVTVSKKEGNTSLHRLNLDAGSNHQIFNNIKPGTVHVGDADNLVCAISDHKKHEFKDVTLLVYNKNLAKNMSVHADKDRPFTCARVHPLSRVVAVGDTSGRIIVYTCLDQPVPSKSILHWHSLPVTVLAWSMEGSVLYSGGGEAVLCKWRQEEGSKPNFVPRIGGPVIGLASGAGVNVVQLENNKIKVIDTLSDTVLSSVAGLARNTGGYPAGLVTDRDRLVMNGGTGMVQVYRVTTDSVYSLDITQQNQVARERGATPHNSEVESVAVSRDGKYLATVDCLWSDLSRIILKFWHWSEETNNFILNTQVEFPHYQGVRSMCFQPIGPNQTVPLLLSVGNDKKAKLWQLEKSWSCVSCLSFRQLPATGGGWSSDGSVIGLSFGHLVTLWSALDMSLKTTLTLGAGAEEITGLEFGRGTCSRYLYTTSHSLFITWDLITLSPCWCLNLAPSPHTRITQSSSFPLVALTQKDTITILSPSTQTTLATIRDVNCTGGCDWLGQELYFLKYSGEMIRLSRERREAPVNTAIMTRPGADITHWLLTPRSGTNEGGGGGAPSTQGRVMRDIESLLTLPLHTVPATSQLSNTIIRNRLIEQPRQRRRRNFRSSGEEEGGEGVSEDVAKRKQKINDIFKFEAPVIEPLELKSFCKLLKKSCL